MNRNELWSNSISFPVWHIVHDKGHQAFGFQTFSDGMYRIKHTITRYTMI